MLISREIGGVPGGSLVLNEIGFFQGVLAQDQRPLQGMKMRTPRTPSPQAVSCSSFLDQDRHCYKAFDGDAGPHSAWITSPVGSRRHELATPQWVTFDFGEGRGVAPTALRIVCDAKSAAVKGEHNSCTVPAPLTHHCSHMLISGCDVTALSAQRWAVL